MARAIFSILLFFIAVVAFTFASTFVHEMSHALAWDSSMPEVTFAESRDDARDQVAHEKRMNLDGTSYRVMEVEKTTIALYPMAILATGATFGMAPSWMLEDQVLGSTFYALDEDDYRTLAAGGEPTGWQEAAMPMVVNGILGVFLWAWLLLRPNALSMAGAWVNATEWRFNMHHAAEIGVHAGVYLAASVFVMMVAAATMAYLATHRVLGRRVPADHVA